MSPYDLSFRPVFNICLYLRELVYRYLAEAILNLDAGDPVTFQHFKVIIQTVRDKIAEFTNRNPDSKRKHRQMLGAIDMGIRSLIRYATANS